MESFNHFPQVAKALPKAVSRTIRKAAFDIQAAAAANAPVDTGNLRNSIYTKTSEGNNYPGGANTNIIDDQVPDVDEWTAYVAVAAAYGIYVEMGTRFMGAQPYLEPAVDGYASTFESVMGQLEDAIRGAM
jgi:HK97 gp10 family phage protein